MRACRQAGTRTLVRLGDSDVDEGEPLGMFIGSLVVGILTAAYAWVTLMWIMTLVSDRLS